MPRIEGIAWIAVVCTAALVVLLVILSKAKGSAKIAYDWPFIVAYTLLFLCIAAMYVLRGQNALALLTAAFAIATAVFDTVENLNAVRANYQLVVSKPKWLCFFVCVLATIPLFASIRTLLARAIVVLLLVGGVGGIAATLAMPSGRNQATNAVFGASTAAIFAFLLADVIFVRNPHVLLR